MHIKDGDLRAYIDNQLEPVDREQVSAHLASCSDCEGRLESLSLRARKVQVRMASLESGAETRFPSNVAYARLQERISQKENQSMFQKMFSRQYRLVWGTLGLIVILAIAMAFPGVRAVANSFLGLFRIQQFTILQVDPENLSQELGSSSKFEYMLSNNVHVEETGELKAVSSPSEASSLAGIPIRLPSELEGDPQLEVQPGAKITFDVDLDLVRAVLEEIGQGDLDLPDSLDGASVEMDLPTAVAAGYGDCQLSSHTEVPKLDPDKPSSYLKDCVTLVQMLSPSISAPPGLDIAKLGTAFLQVMGMGPEEAAQFSQTVDWTTTLVIPIPRYGTDYQSVSVDGVEGTLIEQRTGNSQQNYLLVWVKDDVLYALTGQGSPNDALAIAGSIR